MPKWLQCWKLVPGEMTVQILLQNRRENTQKNDISILKIILKLNNVFIFYNLIQFFTQFHSTFLSKENVLHKKIPTKIN